MTSQITINTGQTLQCYTCTEDVMSPLLTITHTQDNYLYKLHEP